MVSVDGRRLQAKIPAGVNDGAQDPAARSGQGSRRRARRRRGHHRPGQARSTLRATRRRPRHRAAADPGRGPARAPRSRSRLPTGSVKLRVRPNTQNGQEIRIPGRGLPKRGGPARATCGHARGSSCRPWTTRRARSWPRCSASIPQADPRRTGRCSDAHRAIHPAGDRGDHRRAAAGRGRGALPSSRRCTCSRPGRPAGRRRPGRHRADRARIRPPSPRGSATSWRSCPRSAAAPS